MYPSIKSDDDQVVDLGSNLGVGMPWQSIVPNPISVNVGPEKQAAMSIHSTSANPSPERDARTESVDPVVEDGGGQLDVKPNSTGGISVRNMNFFYGSRQVLFDVSLDLSAKLVTAFIGPSGCGKSTFLRTLNRMNDLIDGANVKGSVMIDEQDIYGTNVDVVALRKKVGMVFQKSNPFPKSIFENVAYGPRIHGQSDRRVLEDIVEQSLERASLWHEVKDRLHNNALALSGGQQQRLCIARALAVDPEILLMDEPASALDPASTQKIEELIAELRGQYTIVIVTHNMQQAARVSDATAFFYEGNLIEFGPTRSIFTKPAVRKTEEYITGRFG